MGDLQSPWLEIPFIDLFEYHRHSTATPETSPPTHRPPPRYHRPSDPTGSSLPPSDHRPPPSQSLLRTSPPPTPAPSTPPSPLDTATAPQHRRRPHRTVPSLPWIPIPHQSLLGPPSSMRTVQIRCSDARLATAWRSSAPVVVVVPTRAVPCPRAGSDRAVTWRGRSPLTRAVDASSVCSVRRGRVSGR